MKRALYILAVILGASWPVAFAWAQAPLPPTFFHNGPLEITGYADLDGDGRADAVIIDRKSGALRAGFQLDNTGALSWSSVHAAGFYEVSGVTAGRLTALNRDALAITGPKAGRVVLFSLDAPMAQPVTSSWYPENAVGPLALAAGQINGTTALEDLLLTSTWNGNPENRARLYENTGGGSFDEETLLAESSTRRYDQASRVVLQSGATHQVGLLQVGALGASLQVLGLNEPGLPFLLNVAGFPTDVRYVLNPFSDSIAHLITWSPDATAYRVYELEFDGSEYEAGLLAEYGVPFGIGSLFPVAAGSAARLLIVSADGTQAVLRNVPGDTDNELLSPPDGHYFTGAIPLPNGMNGFALLSGPVANSRTTNVRSYSFDADTDGYVLAHETALAPVSDQSGAGHVLVYAGEPFVVAGAGILARHRAEDWSSDPLIGGNISVTGETFDGPLTGLTSPQVVMIGPTPPSATHVLVSQYAPNISLFSLDAAEGTASGSVQAVPAPGTFSTAEQIALNGPAGSTIYYRTQLDAPWIPYMQPFWLHRDTRLQAYAAGPGPARTATFDAWYRFTAPAGQLSSLDDGIPDFVKIGLGFDPFELPDRDGQLNTNSTLNYLQILLDGENVPLPHTAGTAVTLHVRPLAHDGLADADVPSLVAGFALPDGHPNPGNRVTLHDVSGEPLDSELATSWVYFGLGQTAARLQRAGLGGRAAVTVASTLSSYALDLNPPYDPETYFQGRELAGLVVLPPSPFAPFVYEYGGGSDADEAAAWRAAAIAYYTTNNPPSIGVTMDPLETALTLAFEQWLTRRFVERGLLPADYLPTPGTLNTNRLTLTAYRAGEPALPIPDEGPISGLAFPTPEQVQALEQYQTAADTGHQLTAVITHMREQLRESGDPDIAALRAVSLDVYRISARWGGALPGAFPAPLDALRRVLHTGVMPQAYRNDWTNGLPPAIGGVLTPLGTADYAAAQAGLLKLLNLPEPRPVVTRDLVVRADSAGLLCTVLDRQDNGDTVALLAADGRPFRFPGSFDLVPGIVIRVTGYADREEEVCADETLEVVRVDDAPLAEVISIPFPSGNDSDGNLLDDDWELLFLGGLGNDPFTDLGGGYTLLQAMLDGADPTLPVSYSGVPPAGLTLPLVEISLVTPQTVKLGWHFPAAYAAQLDFQLQRTDSLKGPWITMPVTALDLGNGEFQILTDTDENPDPAFWRLTLGLK